MQGFRIAYKYESRRYSDYTIVLEAVVRSNLAIQIKPPDSLVILFVSVIRYPIPVSQVVTVQLLPDTVSALNILTMPFIFDHRVFRQLRRFQVLHQISLC
jgi:hypothetical protein